MNFGFDSLDPTRSAEVTLQWVGQALLYGTALALATMLLIRLIGRRIPPAVHGALWLVVLLKFVVPVGPSASLSMASLGETVLAYWPAAIRSAHMSANSEADVEFAAQGFGILLDRPTATGETSDSASSWVLGLAILYAVSVLLVAGARIRAYRRFLQTCRALPRANSAIHEVVRRVGRKVGLRRPLIVRCSDEAPAPFVFGTIHPTLVLSRQQLVRPDELEAVILHEVAHLRRGDLLVRYLQWFAGTLLFFWPVVAWVNRRIDLALEHACDEWALRHGRLSAGEYARCLLQAVSTGPRRRSGWFEYRPAAMAANARFLERRIDMILETQTRSKQNRAVGLSATLLIIGWGAFALAGADTPPNDEAQPVREIHEAHDGVHHFLVQMLEPTEERSKEQYAKHRDEFLIKLEAMKNIEAQHAELAEYREGILEDFPQSDLNGDDELSRAELIAFVVALAAGDAEAVMAQFDEADLNADGELDYEEAVRLVSPQIVLPFGDHHKLHQIGVAKHRMLRRLKTEHIAHLAQAEEGRLLIEIAEDARGAVLSGPHSDDAAVHFGVTGKLFKEHLHAVMLRHQSRIDFDVALWLLENVDYDPSAEELSDFAKMLEAPKLERVFEAVLEPVEDR